MSLQKFQVHIPFGELRHCYLPIFLDRRLNPEISFDYKCFELYSPADFRAIAETLREADLSVTFHAPFMDLRPGAIDPEVRRVSHRRIEEVLDLVPWFGPVAIVCHPSFDKRYYISTEDLWLKNSIDTWAYFSRQAEELGTVLVLENVYEHEPGIFRKIFEGVSSPSLRFCFDTGHYHVFSQAPLDEWVRTLGKYLFEVHLHDNKGKVDEHARLGAGTFPFREFFALLKCNDLHPLFTLEAHREEDLWQSIAALEAFTVAGDLAW